MPTSQPGANRDWGINSEWDFAGPGAKPVKSTPNKPVLPIVIKGRWMMNFAARCDGKDSLLEYHPRNRCADESKKEPKNKSTASLDEKPSREGFFAQWAVTRLASGAQGGRRRPV